MVKFLELLERAVAAFEKWVAWRTREEKWGVVDITPPENPPACVPTASPIGNKQFEEARELFQRIKESTWRPPYDRTTGVHEMKFPVTCSTRVQ